MKTNHFVHWLRLTTILVVLALAFSLTSPVRAEGETPTVPTEPFPTEPSPTEPAPTEPAITEPPSTETAAEPGAEAPLPAEGGEPQPPAELSEVVDTLNENNLVLENSAGEVVPLASEEAVELLAEPDPWFISGTVKYRFVGGACPPPDPAPAATETCFAFQANPIQASINYIQANGTLPAGGAIYVDTGTFSGAVTIDGTLANLSSIKALIGKGSDTSAAGYSEITNLVTISNLSGGFRLEGFAVNASNAGTLVTFNNIGGKLVLKDLKVRNSGAGGGIRVINSKATVEVQNVDSSNNGAVGLYVDNTAGTGNVTILSSEFSDNSNTGLQVFTKGAVTLNGVSARFNLGDGALLQSQKGVTVRSSVFNNNSSGTATGYGLQLGEMNRGNVVMDWVYANSNEEYGMLIRTLAGGVTLSNIQAGYNLKTNLYINNCFDGGGICSVPAAPVNVSNASLIYSTNQGGLFVLSSGVVTLTNITADYNETNNYVDTSYAKTPMAVNISRSSFSNTVNGVGLELYSRGKITFNGVNASNNLYSGIILNNNYPTGSVVFLSTLGANTLWGNGDFGLYLNTGGSVSISGLDASFNGTTTIEDGISINAVGNVTVSGTATLPAEFGYNAGTGLEIITRGTITLNFVEAYNNGVTNVDVNNTTGSGNVVMNNVSTSDSLNGSGFSILTTGSVTLKNVSAQGNKSLGALVNNISTRKLGVSITNGRFDNNQSVGLQIETSGAVTLKDVNANGNSAQDTAISFGSKRRDVLFNNTDIWRFSIAATTTTTIKVSHLAGGLVTLRLYNPSNTLISTIGPASTVTYGPTSLTTIGNYRVEVSGSDGAYFIFLGSGASPVEPGGNGTYQVTAPGIQINNTSNSSTAAVSVVNANTSAFSLSGNAVYGLYITSNGNITLTNVAANRNGSAGIQAYNSAAPRTYTFKNIQVTGNAGNGLTAANFGSIVLTGFEANSNMDIGIYFDTLGLVTVQGTSKSAPGNAYNNATVGIRVSTLKAVTLRYANVSGSGNNQVMITVNGGSNLLVSDVTVSAGGSAGVVLTSTSPVKVSNARITGSVFHNLYIDNSLAAVGTPGVILDNIFTEGGGGISVVTKGPVTVNKVTAQNLTYGTGGLRIQHTPGGVGAISIKDSQFLNAASQAGIYLLVDGNVTLTNVNASRNGLDGAFILVDTLLPRNVIVSNSRFDGNAGDGLDVETDGNILVTNSSASENGEDGMKLENDGMTGVGTVTVTATGSNLVRLVGNSAAGLNVQSKRSILVNRVWAEDNSTGVVADNDGSGAVGNLTLTNSSFYYNNTGAVLYTRGKVFGDRLDFTDNFGTGLSVSMLAGTNLSTVIQRGIFFSNSGTGLELTVDGPVTLNGISANGNTGFGVLVDNRTSAGASVSVLGSLGANSLSSNSWSGMRVLSSGPISLSTVTANENGRNGVSLNNYNSGTGTGNITLNNVTANRNIGAEAGITAGISATTNGQVIGSNLRAMLNGTGTAGWGIYIKTVNNNASLSNSVFTSNRNSGIYAYLETTGVLNLSNVFYFGNDAGGGAADPEVRVIN